MRRTMTSIWCLVHSRTKESIERVRGTPPASASMFAEKFSCSWVCLKRLFSTTFATASRLRVMTRRWPVRPEVSSVMSAMPWILPSFTISAILRARLSGLTW